MHTPEPRGPEMRVAILSVVLSLSPALSAYGEDCKNVVFAAPENTLVVFLHNNEDQTQLTEIREGLGRICDAEWSFGMGAYTVKCGGEEFLMRSATESGDIDYNGETMQRQCAN